ncbi:hypothetical protein [Patiriisocius hiemis]|uniref:Uncharacterized protein n=1 Tax=Patiriisocius hiemis TaxID=3075604 RepID=A0ABU2Y9V2_9FLAO|nr:hypothetical protein [Constantimarinum sp. W242]MDT0554802.1 hypothetical protein [Constantimarinum sp. W242]
MKNIYLFLLAIVLLSCSNNDDNSQAEIETNFFPLEANSYWTYTNTNEQGQTKDSLFVVGTEIISNQEYTNLDAQIPRTGFMTVFLSETALRKTETQLLATGNLGIAPVDGLPTIDIPITDFILYDTTFPNGELSSVTNTIEQEFQGIPFEVTYTLSSNHVAILIEDDFENGTSSSSPVTDIKLTLAITALIEAGPITIPVPILSEQEVLTAVNTYVNNIGLTYSEVEISYQLEDLSGLGIELPIPEEGMSSATQILDTFSIGN